MGGVLTTDLVINAELWVAHSSVALLCVYGCTVEGRHCLSLSVTLLIRISSEVTCLVQEARKELKVYQGLKKVAKAQKVIVNMPVRDADCLPSAQRLLWVMTSVVE